MKKAIYFILSLAILMLTSCKNFMDAGNVKKEIQNMINEANAKSVKLVITQDNTMGTFLSSGDKECKLGYSIDVQFNLKKESYIFKGIKAVSTSDDEVSRDDCIEFTITDRDDDKGIYKIAITVVKDASDILIVPDCILVPGVVKEECFPSYDTNGWEQDRIVKITFNKPVELTEFFVLTITDSSGRNLAEYFNEPYMSADNTVLYIPTNRVKKIIETDDTANTKDIIVSIDLSNIKDEEGNMGHGTFQHKYRVNKNVDNIKPELNSVNMYSTLDTQNKYYKQLIDKDFAQWQNTGSSFGDFGANHIKGSVFIEVEGSDVSSEGIGVDAGLEGVYIREKLIKYVNGTNARTASDPYDFSNAIPCTKNETNGKYYCEYQMKNNFDGVIELLVFARDYAGNPSQVSKKYYILKDTQIDSSLLIFDKETRGFDVAEPTAWASAIVVVPDDTQTVSITLSDDAKDKFYNNCSSDYIINAYWGTEKDNITQPISINDNTFTFTRPADQIAYIKLHCEDNIGNTKDIIKIMDPRPTLDGFSVSGAPCVTRNSWLLQLLTNYQIEMKYAQKYIYYIYDDVDSNQFTRVCSSRSTSEKGDDPTWLYGLDYLADNNGSPINIYNKIIRLHVATFYGDFLSPESNEYVEFMIESWPTEFEATPHYTFENIVYAEDHEPELVYANQNNYGEGNQATVLRELGPYLNDVITIELEPMKNSSSYKATISNYKKPGVNTDGIMYTFTVYKFEIGNAPMSRYVSDTPVLYIPDSGEFRFYIGAGDSEGHYYEPYMDTDPVEPQTPEENQLDSFSFVLKGSNQQQKVLSLDEDCSPPSIKYSGNNDFVGYMGSYIIPTPTDNNYRSFSSESTMYNENGKYLLDYYLVPAGGSRLQKGASYTLEELNTYYAGFKKTIEYDPTIEMGDIYLQFGNITDGLYNLCIVLKDIYGNYDIKTIPIVNRLLGSHTYTLSIPDPNDQENGWCTYVLDLELNTNEYAMVLNLQEPYDWDPDSKYKWFDPSDLMPSELYDSEHSIYQVANSDRVNKWKKIVIYRDVDTSSENSGDIGYYNIEFVYMNINRTCNSKNLLEGSNGIQIFSDNAVLVHTYYYDEMLTDTTEGDAYHQWEAKAIETGIVIGNGNFTYTKDNMNDVPKGAYYTTIVRFADGTGAMTDIKQKK